MKRIFIVLMLSSFSYALEAPYLIGATALSDSSIQLTWRNNDVASQGFIVQRKDSTETNFKTIDSVKSATTSTYIDLKNLQSQTHYTYQMLAYDMLSVSVPSNSLQATTLELKPVFSKPLCYSLWHYDTSKAIGCEIIDYSNCEIGFRIYRAEGLGAPYNLIANIRSTNPKATNTTMMFCDTTASINKWYTYKVLEYSNTDSLFSDSSFTYTYRAPAVTNFVKLSKVSYFPVNMPSLSAKAGDSIILKENPSPAGKYSVINIADPKNPKFDGYIDSTKLLSYPDSTLLPIFLKFQTYNTYSSPKVLCRGNNVFIQGEKSIKLFNIQNNSLVLSDSLKTDTVNTVLANKVSKTRIIIINDTLLGVLQFFNNIPGGVAITFENVSSSKFKTCIPTSYLNGSGCGFSSCWASTAHIQGLLENLILVSEDYRTYSSSPTLPYSSIYNHYLYIYDISAQKQVQLFGNIPFADAYNTGYYPSSTLNLSSNSFDLSSDTAGAVPLELFISDIRDPYSHYHDSLNNAIYYDSTHKQNDLQNIIVDAQNRNVFLLFKNALVILNYNQITDAVADRSIKSVLQSKSAIAVHTFSSRSIMVTFPFSRRSSDLFFYDLSGHLIDKILGITSNAVIWRPKTRPRGCYFMVVKSGGDRFVERFIVR